MSKNSRQELLETKIESLQKDVKRFEDKLSDITKKLETIEQHLNLLAFTMIIKMKGEGKTDPEDLLKRFDPEGKELKN